MGMTQILKTAGAYGNKEVMMTSIGKEDPQGVLQCGQGLKETILLGLVSVSLLITSDRGS